MEHVAVLGDGSMGTTIGAVVAQGGRRCVLWCRSETVARAIRDKRRNPNHFPDRELPSAFTATHRLDEAVEGASLIVVCMASPLVRGTARAVADLISARPTVVLSATKGIELPTLKRMSEVLAEELPACAVGTISGPNVTTEIMAGQMTAIVVSSSKPEVITTAARSLQTPRLKVYGNPDLAGVESAGIFKNAVAIGMGIATGLGWGANTRSFLFTRGLAETRQLALALGGEPNTFYGLAGIGDLFLTSTSPDSLNYRLGIELARGRPLAEIVAGMPEVPEGVNSTHGCCALAERVAIAVPLAQRTLRIMNGELDASTLEAALAGPDSYGIDHDAVW